MQLGEISCLRISKVALRILPDLEFSPQILVEADLGLLQLNLESCITLLLKSGLSQCKRVRIVVWKLLNLIINHYCWSHFLFCFFNCIVNRFILLLDESEVVVVSPEVFLQALLVEVHGRHFETLHPQHGQNIVGSHHHIVRKGVRQALKLFPFFFFFHIRRISGHYHLS